MKLAIFFLGFSLGAILTGNIVNLVWFVGSQRKKE